MLFTRFGSVVKALDYHLGDPHSTFAEIYISHWHY